MNERTKINRQISKNATKITHLKNLNKELFRKSLLISDKEQWFTEETETRKVFENGKRISKQMLIGKIHWIQKFKDVSTGKLIPIERTEIVMIDGQWQV